MLVLQIVLYIYIYTLIFINILSTGSCLVNHVWVKKTGSINMCNWKQQKWSYQKQDWLDSYSALHSLPVGLLGTCQHIGGVCLEGLPTSVTWLIPLPKHFPHKVCRNIQSLETGTLNVFFTYFFLNIYWQLLMNIHGIHLLFLVVKWALQQ